MVAAVTEDLQAFRRHRPMWADGEQTPETPDPSPSPSSSPHHQHEHEQEERISWPLISFENTIQNVCCISFLLGLFFASNLLSLLFFFLYSPAKQALWPPLNIYAILLILFHLLEFLTTAIFNPSRVSVDSFLLNNGASYWYAQMMSITEYVVRERYLGKDGWGLGILKDDRVRLGGLLVTMVGQGIRTMAMITAARSFNHRVSTDPKKQEDHRLVTHGVYRLLRHPSYFGFFWWSIGIQLFLANPCSLVLFSFVLWSFFKARIQNEELHLIKFFGKAYVDYRSTTSTYIPFIR
ncbi:uncharacterized protein PGTG_18534 [Puccinia graminis f. sp. tritici CRL 75-36-700-3]|uniref:Protein-S-isoprenylcysteine O-methyltransferase n=1 Tax=Puccinia graminis f. sp. tritici (strain CRL 75-36-700-3 / race SCCL) TaxID=418459 RepID=E3L7L1_PUCGT|nr:uncharacterized protein PGTG_18534 [Puccinia graminis f. sp. tritici CRL 75-36-700-3]EFP92536.2 hypothetical protein PGTG_18534 [Puccinia graminis f. sp. tritici CRL 75-36-700-3]